MIFLPILVGRSHGYTPPHCPYCHKPLPGWTVPRECWFDNPWLGIPALVAALVLSAVLVMIALLIIMNWIDANDGKTLVQAIADMWHEIISVLRRVW